MSGSGKKLKAGDIAVHCGVGIVLLVAVLPAIWLLLSSFKWRTDITATAPTLIPQYTLHNWYQLFERGFFRNFVNGVIVVVGTTITCVPLGAALAYVLSRFKIPGRENIALWILSLRMIPPIAMIFPYYLLMRSLGLLDTKFALVLINTCMNVPLGVWMIKGFIEDIPLELEEAALIDGCSKFQAFRWVILPVIRPGLAVTAILIAIFTWNEFLFALILGGSKAMTATVRVAGFIGWVGVEWGMLAAGGIFIIAPIIAVSFFVQKHIVRGLTFGAIK